MMDEQPDNSTKIPNDVKNLIRHLADQIWLGRATLMVGAGFSQNADAISSSSPKMPTWQQLAGKFIIDSVDKDDSKFKSPLVLAQEYETVFGRTQLINLIKKEIPDTQYEPSKLHTGILELSWTDVFTQNYDTLLERAAKNIVERNYEVVVNPIDLALAKRPRIIKLHGSFPSQYPFICTEEDYRTYPKKYAAFVNTVQQSLLENTDVHDWLFSR